MLEEQPIIYDAEGNRVEKQGVGVTDTIYFGGQPIARLSAGQWTDLVYGPNGLLAEVPGTQNGAPVYRVTDHLGTTVGNLQADGTFINPLGHKPFGGVFSGNTSDPYQFTGLERDQESGFDHTTFRQYASTAGRWMSPDPYNGSMDLNNPQSLNRYAYALNNPLRFADPSGLSPCANINANYTINSDGSLTEDAIASTFFNCGFWQDVADVFAGVGKGFADFGSDIAHLFGFGHASLKASTKPRPDAVGSGMGGHYLADQVFHGPGSGVFAAANKAVTYATVGYGTAIVAAPFAAEGAAALGYEGLAGASLGETSVVPQQLILGDHVMMGGDAFHLGARMMAGEVMQNGFPVMTGLSQSGFSNPYLLYALPGEINGVAGTFTVGGHLLAGGACYITHACFYPY